VVMWGLPGFGINITSSHLTGMWYSARQPWKKATSQGRDVFSVRCSWAGMNPSGPAYLKGLKKV